MSRNQYRSEYVANHQLAEQAQVKNWRLAIEQRHVFKLSAKQSFFRRLFSLFL